MTECCLEGNFSGEIGLSELCVVKRENPGFFLSINKMAAEKMKGIKVPKKNPAIGWAYFKPNLLSLPKG